MFSLLAKALETAPSRLFGARSFAYMKAHRTRLPPRAPRLRQDIRQNKLMLGVTTTVLAILVYSWVVGAPEDVRDLYEGTSTFEEKMKEELGVDVTSEFEKSLKKAGEATEEQEGKD